MNSAEQPVVTVVVPLYNKQQYVTRALASIEKQTYQDFEVIIIDDGSTDCGADMARAFCTHDARFRVVSQSNAGPGAARNRGIELARGRFVAFLDADDEWLPDYLS